jgi:DNA processing protein
MSQLKLEQNLRFLALSTVKGLGPVRLQQLLAYCEQHRCMPDQDAFWQHILQALSGQSWLSAQGLMVLEQRIVDPADSSLSWPERDNVMQWLQQSDQRQLLALGQADYPYLLRQISDPPLLLYLQGDSQLLHKPQLAIVGARRPTAMGASDARAFASALTELGWVVTSGLAEGVDASAHQGALQANGSTIAVLGTGIDCCYPAQHRGLQQQVAERGLLVSEYPLGTPPRGVNFPRRNRIVSGLSVGVLVVEAALKSGSLISARLASEQGREVFAIPGSIHQAQSKGCHQLIKQGAKLTETVMDIHEELSHWLEPVNRELETESFVTESPEMSLYSHHLAHQPIKTQPVQRSCSDFPTPEAYQVWQAIAGGAGTVDELVVACHFDAVQISQHCLLLEMQGYLQQQSGRWLVI